MQMKSMLYAMALMAFASFGYSQPTGNVKAKTYCRQRFATKYTSADVALLAQVDRAHERLSGPVTRRILKREYAEFGKRKFARLAGISVAHLYNLRRSAPTWRILASLKPHNECGENSSHRLNLRPFAWSAYSG
jgi:hypothetical protein